MLQRASKSKWASEPIKAEAKAWAKGELFKAGKALHHKLSKEHLASIVEENQKARGKSTGARRFWQAVVKGTKKSVPGDTSETKRIWNIPANLEVGPKIVSNNVGMELDPNTVPSETGDGSRRLTFRSSQFREMLDTWRESSLTGREPTDEEWESMAENLEKANQWHSKLTKTLLSEPLTEQWEKTSRGGGYNRKLLPELQVEPADDTVYVYYEEDDIESAFEYPVDDLGQLDPQGLIVLTREEYLDALQ